MGRENKIYHLCNLSVKIIFRNEEDYLIAICRLAACAYSTSTEVWAYSFMSTHFHLIVRSENLSKFIRLFKLNISIWHNKKYINNIHIDIGKRELVNEGEVRTAVNYVLKNPIHHGILNVAFQYTYSSAQLYFKEQIYPCGYFESKRITVNLKKPSELQGRDYQKLFASHKVPDDYLVLENKLILPDSFVKVSIIEKLYSNNVRDFLFHMNKPLKEELEMFESGTNSNGFNESRVSLFGKLTDIQVCEIVDDLIAPKTYTQITPEEKVYLAKLLAQKGVDKFQFERAI